MEGDGAFLDEDEFQPLADQAWLEAARHPEEVAQHEDLRRGLLWKSLSSLRAAVDRPAAPPRSCGEGSCGRACPPLVLRCFKTVSAKAAAHEPALRKHAVSIVGRYVPSWL